MTTFASYIIIYCSQSPEECEDGFGLGDLALVILLAVLFIGFLVYVNERRR